MLGVKPILFRSALKRGSDRKVSSEGSTAIQGIQVERSWYAFSSHRKASVDGGLKRAAILAVLTPGLTLG